MRALGKRIAVLVVVLVMAGCTGGELQTDPRVEADGPSLTLAFGGDVNFEGRTQELLDKDPETAFGPAANKLAAADLAIVNLETPITTRGTPQPKRYLFRTDPRAVTALTSAGVDVVSLANNHTLDYGQIGLADTLAAARAGKLPTVGAGRNAAEAFAPWRTTVRGIRVAVFAFSQVSDLATEWTATPHRPGLAVAVERRQALDAVRAARATSDVIVVVPHWGSEHDRCPTADQKSFAADLSAAGADVVVGAHAHVLQGQGYLGPTFVAYGMGNLLWGSGLPAPEDWRGGVLKLTLRGRTVVERDFTPTTLSPETRQPLEFTAVEADKERARVNGLRDCASLARSPAS
ncbi:CapA family protein [Kribbella sp. CA-253562]|uniref:CapA family protein n=1 Tax=Kribbella sp. CA-253562 TaxID=3239942 RepID=UPI003D9045B6